MQKTRLYSNNKLISWTQRQCEKCQRFLSKREEKYCKSCYYKMYLLKEKEYYHSSKGKEVKKRCYNKHLIKNRKYGREYYRRNKNYVL